MQRKMQEDARKGKKKEERRKTLAELALEAGYTVKARVRLHRVILRVWKDECKQKSKKSFFTCLNCTKLRKIQR